MSLANSGFFVAENHAVDTKITAQRASPLVNVNKLIEVTKPLSEITLLGFLRLPRLLKYDALSKVFSSMERYSVAVENFSNCFLIKCWSLTINTSHCLKMQITTSKICIISKPLFLTKS